MSDIKKVKIQNIIESQIPEFLNEENPLFKEFLNQYYISQEYPTGAIDLATNILEYKSISGFNNEKFFSAFVPPVVTKAILSIDDVINVSHTIGFPDSYGLIKIDDEIITYTSKTKTTFEGCVRGFSAIDKIPSDSQLDSIYFTSTEAQDHPINSSINNLNLLFYQKLFEKFKFQFLPGFENRNFVPGINLQNILTRAKDFYTTKGTDVSYKILFKILYGVDISLIKPQEYMLRPSDSNYFVTKNILVEKISGDVNPLDLDGKTLFQNIPNVGTASAAIYNVEYRPVEGRNFYEISLDSTSFIFDFISTKKTNLSESEPLNTNSLLVDSTIGFPKSGTLLIKTKNANIPIVANYSDKTANQFLNVSGIVAPLNEGDEIIENNFAYSYLGSDIVEFRILNIIDTVDYSQSSNLRVDDRISLSTFGLDLLDKPEFNSWIYNIPTTHNIQSVTPTSEDSIWRIELKDAVKFTIGESIKLLNPDFPDDNELIVTVRTTINTKTIEVLSPVVITNKSQIKKIIRKSNVLAFPEVNSLTSGVQNTYSDEQVNNLYVTSSGLPDYQVLADSRAVRVSTPPMPVNAGSATTTILNTDKVHRFYTGEKIYYFPSSVSGIITGQYYVTTVGNSNDSSQIKLSLSNSDLYSEKYINVGYGVTNDYFVKNDYENKTLEHQKLLKKITLTKEENTLTSPEEISTNNKTVGILVNGVEIYSSTLYDENIYYGKLDNVLITNNGSGYDVINYPKVDVFDSEGYGAKVCPSITGSVKEIKIIRPGIGYQSKPKISIIGGNGSGAVLKPNLIKSRITSGFRGDGNGVNPSTDVITFVSNHNFDDGEQVIYLNNSNSPISPLQNNSVYFVGRENDTQIKLYENRENAAKKQNNINLVGISSGFHYFRTLNSKNTITKIYVEDSGSNYSNKFIRVPSIQSTNVNEVNGVNTFDNYIFAKNHTFKDGDLVVYSSTETEIVGLNTETQYYVHIIDENKFRLSLAGVGNSTNIENYKNKKYVKFNSIGVGTHTFSYPPIQIVIESVPEISSSEIIEPILEPVVLGSFDNIFIEESGFKYGVPNIVNFHRRPNIGISSITSEAILKPIVLDGKVVDIQILSHGAGYTNDIDVVISGSGRYAEFKPIVENGEISDVIILNGGINYLPKNTELRIKRRGIDAKFIGNIFEWKINQVEKNKRLLTNSDEGVLVPSKNQQYGLQFINFYPPKLLRKSLNDHLDNQNREVLTELHSPILGWSYDGYPIYGPYTKIGLEMTKVRSSYQKRVETDSKLRPIGQGFPDGFFIQDYQYDSSTGDLDQYNGKFVINSDFPNGTYAYFLTIDNEINSNPVYPYVFASELKNSIIKENTNPAFNQDLNISDLGLIRNVGPYYINSVNSNYNLINKVKDSYRQTFIVNEIESSGIDGINVYNAGQDYKVGDIIFFDNSGTDGTGISAVVSGIKGKDISNLQVGINTFNETTFIKSSNRITGITEVPHGFRNEDRIVVSSMSNIDFRYLEGFRQIIVNEKSVGLLKNIGTILETGTQTSIDVNDTSVFEVNDYIRIDNELLQITKISEQQSKLYVNRLENIGVHTVGISSVTLLPRKFTYFLNDSSGRDIIGNNTFYFNPYSEVGIGSTTTVYEQFDGSLLTIPSKSIYIPNHKYQTGQALTYGVGIGGTGMLVSNNLTSPSYNLDDGQTVYVVDLGRDFIGLSTIGFVSISGIGTDYNSVYFLQNPPGIGIGHSLTTQNEKILGDVKNYFIDVVTNDDHQLLTGDKVKLNLNPNDSRTIKLRYDPNIRKITTDFVGFAGTYVNLETSEIYIENNTFKTGDKVVYYASPSGTIGNLVDNGTYFIIKYNSDKVKLAEYPSDAKSGIAISFSSTETGTHNLALINPPLEITKGDTVTFDVSDPSLLEMNFKLYKDLNLKKELESYKYQTNSGDFKIRTATTQYPSELYYTFLSNSKLDTRKDEISKDDEVIGRNMIRIIPSQFRKEYPIISTGNTSFKIDFQSIPENTNYNVNTGVSTIFYTSNSKFITGPINDIKINFKGKGYRKVPKIKTIRSVSGKNATLEPRSSSIGKVSILNRVKDGFDYPTDATLKPFLSSPAIIQVKDILRVEKINILSGGSGYNTPPSLRVIGSNELKLSASIQGGSVTSVKVDKNVNDLKNPLRIVPTRNSNGYDIDNITRLGTNVTLELINSNSQIYPLVSSGYGKTETEFPFAVGDEIFIENCRVDLSETDESGNIIPKNNYNSSNYGYRFFKVTGINTNNYTVTYSMDGIGSNLGNYVNDFGYGSVVNRKNMAEFEMILADDLSYFSKETVVGIDNSGREVFSAEIMENGWDNEINQMRVINAKGTLKEGNRIKGLISNLTGTVTNVNSFNIPTSVGISREKVNDFGDRNGLLNDYQQRISDNNYYQKFSYSIKSTLPYSTWRESVKSLVHPAGFKEFSDLDVVSIGSTILNKDISVNVLGSSLDLTINIDSEKSMYTRNNFGMVTEEDQFEDGSIQRIIFDEGIALKSYILNKTNKVIPIDDISPQFTGFTTTTGGVVVGLTTFKLKNKGNPLFYKEFNSSSSSIVNLNNNSFKIINHNFQSGQKVSYEVVSSEAIPTAIVDNIIEY